jgi:glycosyltransferase involved in cell wall biosynthesis
LSNSRVLFLITKTYPFGNGEQYVTNELTCLAKVFDKIIIYPNDYYSANTEHNKQLPTNVEVLNFNQTLQKHQNTIFDYWYLIKNTVGEFIETDDKKNFFKNFKWNLINFWTQYQIAKSFSNYLIKSNFTSDNAVFYSYWFHKSAILLGILKDKKLIRSFVSRAHSIDLYHHKWGIINEQVKVPPFKLFKLKRVDKIYTVSKHGEAFFKKHYTFLNNKVNTSYLGVFNTSNESQKKQDAINQFHIVTCSGIDFNKRVIELAKSLTHIKHSVKWTHFGDGNLKEELFKTTSTFTDNIQFDFKGITSNQEVKKFYVENNINLFINLSIVEGLPVSIMEAMMCEIAILATSVYGTPEAVIEKQNGFLLPVNFTQQQVIDKLNYCMENKNQLLEMGKKSHEIYSQKFDANKNYMEFANNIYLIPIINNLKK